MATHLTLGITVNRSVVCLLPALLAVEMALRAREYLRNVNVLRTKRTRLQAAYGNTVFVRAFLVASWVKSIPTCHQRVEHTPQIIPCSFPVSFRLHGTVCSGFWRCHLWLSSLRCRIMAFLASTHPDGHAWHHVTSS